VPYFIYRIEQSQGAVVKKLQLVNRFTVYKQAKSNIRQLREQGQDRQWQMVFAESELQAEQLLQEKREKPILMEWEK